MHSASDLRKFIRCHTENGVCQCCNQRNILPGIADRLQNRTQNGYFLRLQQIVSAAGCAANSPPFQRLLEMHAHRTGRTKQNHDVIRLDSAKIFSIPHIMLPGQKRRYLGCNIGAFFPVGVITHGNGMERHLRLA